MSLATAREAALRVARRGARHDAEDLVQDALVKLLRAGRPVDRRSLLTALRSVAVDAARRRAARRRRLDDEARAGLALLLGAPPRPDDLAAARDVELLVLNMRGRHGRNLRAHLAGEPVSRPALCAARRALRETMLA